MLGLSWPSWEQWVFTFGLSCLIFLCSSFHFFAYVFRTFSSVSNVASIVNVHGGGTQKPQKSRQIPITGIKKNSCDVFLNLQVFTVLALINTCVSKIQACVDSPSTFSCETGYFHIDDWGKEQVLLDCFILLANNLINRLLLLWALISKCALRPYNRG